MASEGVNKLLEPYGFDAYGEGVYGSTSTTGASLIQGDSSVTFQDLHVSSTVNALISGDLGVSLNNVTSDSITTVNLTGDTSITLGDEVLSSDGSVVAAGAGAALDTLIDDLTLNSDASSDIEALLNIALSGMSISSDASRPLTKMEEILVKVNELWRLAGLDKNNQAEKARTHLSGGTGITAEITLLGEDAIVTRQDLRLTAIPTGDTNEVLALERLNDLWQLAGLDIDNPMTVTATTRVTGDISLDIEGDTESSVTLTRQ